MLVAPGALLLDFGGVITDGPESPQWTDEVAERVGGLLAEHGVAPVPRDVIVTALLTDDRAADGNWQPAAPVQRSASALWAEVLAVDWPAAARELVALNGALLVREIGTAKFARHWRLRPGIDDLIRAAAARAVPLAVVSNTICGELHREFLESAGLGRYFDVQLYSDEEGVRKPNPELVWRATRALGVDPATCWFVGDTVSRDVLVARRSGVGAAVLMRSGRLERPPHPDGVEPDVSVADPVELHALLAEHW